MAKQLAALSMRWWDLEPKLRTVWPDLASLIMQYRNQQSGSWPRLVVLFEMLDERLGKLGANSAQDAVAARDMQVKKLLLEIAGTKKICQKVSTEYWQLRNSTTAFKDLGVLVADVEKAVKDKSGFFSNSKSLPLLKTLKDSVAMMAADARHLLKDEPHKPNAPEIN